jgi:hypothetical protein
MRIVMQICREAEWSYGVAEKEKVPSFIKKQGTVKTEDSC